MNTNCLSNFEEINSVNNDIDQLKNLDNLLKCGICYEYYDTCVVTDCSHNFCSLCIRKYIQYKTECPTCFHQLYDSQLRTNRIVDDFLNIFLNLKDRLIRNLRTFKTLKPNCVYISPAKVTDDITPEKKSSSAKKNSITPINENENEINEEHCDTAEINHDLVDLTMESNKVVIPKMFQSPRKKNSTNEQFSRSFVSCPVCQVKIPERNINLHLDSCLNRDKKEKKNEQEFPVRRKHLPKFVYRLMSISTLRAKLKEYGLNAQGDFETLKSRLQRYTVLYNAECDKPNPKPVQEIICQVDREEKVLLSQKLPKTIFTNLREDSTSADKLNEQYLKENEKSFRNLIKNVKKRKETNIEKENSNNVNSITGKPAVIICDCKPSTSKFNNNVCFASSENSNDQIDVEEHGITYVKSEPELEIKEESLGEELTVNGDNDNLRDSVVFALRKNRRTKRNLRDDFEVQKNVQDERQSHDDEETDFDSEEAHSPVLKKQKAKKRK